MLCNLTLTKADDAEPINMQQLHQWLYIKTRPSNNEIEVREAELYLGERFESDIEPRSAV
jgi:hypothetical protein